MITASVPGMPGVGSRMSRMRCAVTSTSMWASSSTPEPNTMCMRPFSRGVTLAPVTVQRSSMRLSVKARHTRSTGTPMSVR